jgi:ABC-type nickel/cobalt efflux system permease component RcnA
MGFQDYLAAKNQEFIKIENGIAIMVKDDTLSRLAQVVSYSLIAVLGLGMLVKNGFSLGFKSTASSGRPVDDVKDSKMALVLWAVTVGLVPCPGVVMTVLFCLSLDMLVLGLWLALFISPGMATTIALAVVSAMFAKGALVNTVADTRSATVGNVIGIITGFIITTLGLISLAVTFG